MKGKYSFSANFAPQLDQNKAGMLSLKCDGFIIGTVKTLLEKILWDKRALKQRIEPNMVVLIIIYVCTCVLLMAMRVVC